MQLSQTANVKEVFLEIFSFSITRTKRELDYFYTSILKLNENFSSLQFFKNNKTCANIFIALLRKRLFFFGFFTKKYWNVFFHASCIIAVILEQRFWKFFLKTWSQQNKNKLNSIFKIFGLFEKKCHFFLKYSTLIIMVCECLVIKIFFIDACYNYCYCTLFLSEGMVE